jgi:hypothetical protein
MRMLQWLCTLLTVLFVAMKLTGHLAWGWLAVLSPALAFLFTAFCIMCAVVLLQKHIAKGGR